MIFAQFELLLVCFLAVSVSLSCKTTSENSDRDASSQLTDSDPNPKGISETAHQGLQEWRSLLKEFNRAEHRIGGLFIDLGTSDQYKYTRGNWQSGWSSSARANADVTAASLVEKEARLNTYLVSRPKEFVVRARSTKGRQTMTVALGSKTIGDVALSEKWRTQRLSVPRIKKERVIITLTHDKREAIEVDYVWLASQSGQKPPSHVAGPGPSTIGGGLRRALHSPGVQTYSYYLHVPKKAKLFFEYAAKSPLDFVVRVDTKSRKTKEIFRATSTSSWQSAEIDLGAYSGQAIRLELATEGTGSEGTGSEGTGSEGAWGEPSLWVPQRKSRQAQIASATKAKNLIMIVMDTTRADQFRRFDRGNSTHTPAFDAFSRSATVFTRAYNNANWTKPSVLSILSGLYPATHTATKANSMVPEGIEFISQHLKKNGLQTQGYSANPVVSDKFGFERGWDGFSVFYDKAARSKALFRRASSWVAENGDTPFFLYLQPIDSHTTYSVAKPYWSRYYKKKYRGPFGKSFTRDDQQKINDRVISPSKDDISWIRALYRGEVTYQDQYMGRFLDKLNDLGRLDDTIVVITNDHGEELFDHKNFGHGWTLYEEMIRAPLVIHYPALFPKGKVSSEIVEHVDLAPTLLEALGLPPMKGPEGQSFLSALHGEILPQPQYAISASDNGKRSIHVGNWKLQISAKNGWTHLFNMTSKNPEKREQRSKANLAGRLCEVYMGEGMAIPNKRNRRDNTNASATRFEPRNAEMDQETRKQMEALGYL